MTTLQELSSSEEVTARYNAYNEVLGKSVVVVTFTKVDGTVRQMVATRRPDLVIVHENKTGRVKAVNENILPVFDLYLGQWRSITLANVTEVVIVGPEMESLAVGLDADEVLHRFFGRK